MISVLSGSFLILELSTEVDEKKACFFRGDRRLKVPKLEMAQREPISYYLIYAVLNEKSIDMYKREQWIVTLANVNCKLRIEFFNKP